MQTSRCLCYFNNMGLITTKPVLGEFEINKGADHHVQPSSLISALVYRLLESIISRVATSESVSVASRMI